MSNYTPNKWMVVKITGNDLPPVHKVFASWSGGYLDGDSWKLNSGITKVTETEDYFLFDGFSGSTYVCRKGMYGATGWAYGVLGGMIEQASKNNITIEVLPEETNFMEIDYV